MKFYYSTKMKNTIGHRIEQVRLEKGLSKTDVWKGAGRSSGVYAQWLAGGSLKGETLVAVARVLGVTPTWLETGRGEKYLTNVSSAPDIKGAVPLISLVQAGVWMEAIDNLQPGEGERIPTTYRARDYTYALRVQGDSMEPKFPAGAILIIEPEEEPMPGKYVIVRQASSQEATFKQLVQDGNKLYLKPINPRYPILELHDDDVFCGVVKRVEMDV
jgi:SOS-response transcriptional repressor LexA